MTNYRNIGGNSGIRSYEISSNSIAVTFNDGSIYLYNYSIPGKSVVDHMKTLAIQGSGLNSYIGRVVKKSFAKKLR